MNQEAMKARTQASALRVIRLSATLPRNRVGDVIGRQLLRSATSVGANYRAAVRAKSKADFVNKLKIVEEEADESSYWLELLVKSGTVPETKLADLLNEYDEITAIVVASLKTARSK